MNKNKLPENIFIGIIAGMSLLGMLDILLIKQEINFFSKILSIGSSLIGLMGILLYYREKNTFTYFILFWILVQFFEISQYLVNAEGVKYWKYIFISKQFL